MASLAGVLGSCFSPELGPAPFACVSSTRCPEGYRCVAGVCRNDDARVSRDAPPDRRAPETVDRGPDRGEAGALDHRASDGTKPDTVAPATPGFAIIGPGTFTMGSPSTESCHQLDEVLHDVTLTHVFEIKKTEVTQGEFDAVYAAANKPQFLGASRPREMISWDEAAAYLNKLSTQKGLTPCYTGCPGSGCKEAAAYVGKLIYGCPGYRFPTEAEWEYAYRAGTNSAYYSGNNSSKCESDGDPNLDLIAWYYQTTGTHDVAGKQPNAWGLYDMAGNVWEWTTDWYGSYPSSAVADPAGPTTGSERVTRGGAWNGVPQDARAAARRHPPSGTSAMYTEIGFRAARTLK